MDGSTQRPPDRDRYLLEEEVAELLAGARALHVNVRSFLGPEDPLRFLELMANTGIRPTEATALTTSDVVIKEQRIHVQTIKQKKDKRTGKPKRVFRDVDLSEDYAAAIADWLPKDPEARLFPYTRFTMWRLFKRAAAAAKLRQTYTLYGLRHTRAIYLLEWTEDLKYVQHQLGHSSIAVTSLYLHCLPGKRQQNKAALGTFSSLAAPRSRRRPGA